MIKYIQPIFIILLGGILAGTILLGGRRDLAPISFTKISAAALAGTQPAGTSTLSSTPLATTTLTTLSLPSLITEIPLAPEDGEIVAMLLDSQAGRLYVTDRSGQLHILDTQSYNILQTILVAPDAASRLTLAAAQDKLFATANQFSTVVDTRQLTITQVISPGGHVALDPSRNRFFIGASPWSDTPVRVYDLDDLSLISTLAQTGTPVYNPARDELYLLSDHLQAIDLKTLEPLEVPLKGNIFSPIGFYKDLHFLPDSNSLVLDVNEYFSISGRPASTSYYSFFAADTLSQITDPNALPHTEFSCFGGLIVPTALPDLQLHYDPFESLRFQIEAEATGQRTWYEGVRLERTNARTGQLYYNSMVFDLAGLKPLGLLPVPACIERVEPETGRLFGVRKNTLVIFSETGGDPLDLPPLLVETLSTGAATLKFSPTYSQDQTIMVDGSQIYRSTDGGQTWVQLRGGLPIPHLSIELAITFSPNFAQDQTLFAAQSRPDQEVSFGLYRSTDGGDTWQPVNEGLTRLGVYQVEISPNFSLDHTLLIESAHNALADQYLGPNGYRYATLRSIDRGQSWTQVMTRSYGLGPPVPTLPVTALPTTHFRWLDHGPITIQRSQDGGLTWTNVFTLPDSDTADLAQEATPRQVIFVSPDFARNPTVFIHLRDKTYRSVDGGNTWEPLSFSDQPGGLVLSPNFVIDQTIYGYTGGEIYRLTGQEMAWVSITPTCPPGSDPCWFSEYRFSPHFSQNRLMLTTSGPHIFSTTDAGETWRTAALPLTDTDSGYFEDMIFSPDPNIVFILYGQQLFRSADQGQSWVLIPYTATSLHFSPTYNDDQTLYFRQQNYLDYKYSAGDFLFRSTDSGGTWQQWNLAENFPNSSSDLFISPADQQGQYHLFFSTDQQIIRLNPAELAWVPLIEPTPTPSPTATPSP